ncbi:replicative helicase loader/inhibitor [Bacillus sp. JJ1122]|uniref:replicative helicase loader/inhibitor n=1 Tax=Bacillus sp. JJ1122 TaxID=3122951 RepID=UPI002FFD7710
MTRDEVVKLLTMSQSYYQSFKVNQHKIDDWYEVLKSYSFDTLKKNLKVHATKSAYPPSVKDLISGPYRDPGTRAVANRPETELFSQAKH